MKAAVTGASGLVGGHVVRAFARAGHDVRAVVRATSRTRELAGTELAVADLGRPARLRAAFEGCDVVVHCAGAFSYAEDTREVNVAGTEAVLLAAADAGVNRLVVTSSSVTCGAGEDDDPVLDGMPAYFAAKAEQEALALRLAGELALEVVVACPTVVIGGPDHRLVPSNALLVRYLLDPLRTTFPGGGNLVAARDVGDGHLLLAEHGVPGRRYLLGGENLTWRRIHELVSELCGTHGPGLTATHTSAYVGASVLELAARLTGGPALSTRAEAATIGRRFWYGHERAAALGYAPMPVRRALAGALSWLITSDHVPRPVRAWLRPLPEVYEARELFPAPPPRVVPPPA
ncbi:dihydroflavonol-4-reductase [Nonomuraea solani]|uniref:Dihydroflavonol-4-reductase n=1 Tax=Nonomuraea solani TaxID=1144553 RepID=A0A1H6E3A2_9ACTN|nr:NAD-dependent epimerase/dehydratase family protein [Nonomuraea solani]SEG91799.1 dihydroflavonol-4-reductase [Nonomuraea solani]